MGLEDRDYAREPESGFQLTAPQSMVGGLLAVNLVLWLLDVVFDGRLSDRFDLSAQLLREPWNVWQLVTYGFLHDHRDIMHILNNMLWLYIFGRELEEIYGKWEFFRIYLASIILGGLVWVLWRNFVVGEPFAQLVGASAAVSAIIILYAMRFPEREILIFGVMPVKVWALAGVIIVINVFGIGMASRRAGSNVAYEAHIAGMAFAFFYFHFDWNLGRFLPAGNRRRWLPRGFGSRPNLKLHEPTDEPAPLNLSAETDRILAKIHASGYDSLTDDERRTLERASARARAHKGGS